MKISINSRTTGKFKESTINGRNHIITSMMPIRGDTAMNGMLYPNDQVINSFQQLDNIPAPNGHPKINGVHVSAFSPLAMNAFNVGAFVRSPKMQGKRVITEFVIDETVANSSEDGREIIKRIKNGEKVGVSTGLNIDTIVNQSGKDDLGADYTRVANGFHFDHVAILLHEAPAGAGTELILNTADDKDPIYVVNMADELLTANELSVDEIQSALNRLISTGDTSDIYAWVHEIFPDSKTFIYRMNEQLFKMSYATSNDDVLLVGVPVEVKKKIEFEETQTTNQEDHDMDKKLFILSIIACTNNAFTKADNDRLNAMNESDLADVLSVEVDQDTAKKVLATNGFDFTEYENFQANQAGFKTYLEATEKTLADLRDKITSNSDYKAEDLEGKKEAELNTINALVEKSKVATRIGEGRTLQTVNSDSSNNYDM